MPIEVGWFIPGRIGLVKLTGDCTQEEFHGAAALLTDGYNASNHAIVFTLLDSFEHTNTLPIKAMQTAPTPDKTQWAISLGEAKILNRFVGSAAANVMGIKVNFWTATPRPLT